MLTPIDIQNKTLKAGMGYKKSDVDELIVEIYTDYDYLYRKNAELREKMHILSEGIQYYKKIEKTIQGALMLAEQTASETQRVAEEKAAAIVAQANNQAEAILADARAQRSQMELSSRELLQEYERYRLNFRHMMSAQIEMLDHEDTKLAQMRERLGRLVTDPESAGAVKEEKPAFEAVQEAEAVVAAPVEEKPEEPAESALPDIVALREEGKELSEKMAAIENEEALNGDVSEDEAREAEETAQIEDFIEFAATKDLSSETQTIMEMLKKIEAEKAAEKQS
ncbi:MAG: DivIVA domain-containing protein [Lachnospiraceae bacterium]|nr:DivIVA domain-containing protein [Lachnospiraceae bacterium]MBQ9592419.1 DivIVA domain-containing protein [Lachnospiraceae bacterium]